MACLHPIWIRNRRYFDPKRPRSLRLADDDHRSALALRPWDVSRQWLLVPCGKCEDCLRRSRNDWYVRLERELSRCRHDHHQAVFVTITISPKYYDRALSDPTWFIRKWLERVRHSLGHSYKHAFFQEFGTHPKIGTEPRLHFHGFIFGFDVSYTSLRNAVSDLGWIWLGPASNKRARYVVKYVVKQIQYNGNDQKLSRLLSDRRYTRKFVSPGVGDYLGNRKAPSASVSTWDYLDYKTGTCYSYTIPRYYNRYLQPKDEIIRAVRSSDVYSRFSRSPLVRHVVDLCCKRFLDSSSLLSYRESYSWMLKNFRFFSSGNRRKPDFDLPTFLDDGILDFWRSNYDLCIT